MASNPLGPATRNLSSNVSTETFVEVHKLASDSGVSVSQYVRAIVENAVQNKILVRENPDSKKAYYAAVIDHKPLPKITLEVVPDNELRFPDEHDAKVAEPPQKYKGGSSKASKR